MGGGIGREIGGGIGRERDRGGGGIGRERGGGGGVEKVGTPKQ